MKKFFLILGVFAAMLSTLVSCQEDATPSGDGLDAVSKGAAVKSALKVMSNTKALERLGFGASSMMNSEMGMSAARTQSGARKLSTARTTNDSTEMEEHETCEWTTCATESFVENADGSYTWTLDYGPDGCEENDYFMKGKLVETYAEDGNKFSGTIEFFDFGDEFSIQNGKQIFSGTWEDSGNLEDSTGWAYAGTYEHEEDLVYTYKDDEVEETYTVVSSGKQSYDKTGFTVTQEEYTYTASNGESFSGSVTSPLFYSYACESEDENSYIFVYVSGAEAYTYEDSEGSGQFAIDYGNGACDNMVTITENGESYEIDLGKEWEEEWEDEEEKSETSGS